MSKNRPTAPPTELPMMTATSLERWGVDAVGLGDGLGISVDNTGGAEVEDVTSVEDVEDIDIDVAPS